MMFESSSGVEMRKTMLGLILVFVSGVAFRNVSGNSQDRLSESSLRQDQRPVHRVKRSILTSSEMFEVLTAHNNVRSLEGSSDMQSLRYNGMLEDLAEAWAEKCQWYHGQAKAIPSTTLGYSLVGQNLYAISGGASINITNITISWYNEKSFYNYNDDSCPSNKMCGHYTQVVWADTYEVGCAYVRCQYLNQSDFTTDALFFVCNYGPGGNIEGKRPFQIGAACSNCSNGQFWCSQGLCNRSCSLDPGPNCACTQQCQNGGTLVPSTCSCTCAYGWGGFDCSEVCKNYDARCDPPAGQYGWPPSWCNEPTYGETIRRYCPLMCGQCSGVVNSMTTHSLTTPLTVFSGSTACYQFIRTSTYSFWIIGLLIVVFNLRH